MNALAEPAVSILRGDNGLGESAHRFGSGQVGILHRLPGDAPSPIAVILLNAGLVHRMGPFRGYVAMARHWAAAGFATFRFDQSGLGDSAASSVPSAQRRLAEVQAAMALIQAQTGAERFVLAGICSGADDAFHMAVGDSRVAGAVLLDGLAHRTAGFWFRHLLPRLLNPGKLLGHLRRRAAHKPGPDDYRDFPARATARVQLAQLVARDVRLLFLYTGGAYHYFNHPGQLAACLGRAARSPQVTLLHWRECDHTFYLRQDRERLLDTVAQWLQQQFGHATAGGS